MRKSGFTQAELVTVAAILGALAAITIPRVMAKPEEAKATVCNSNVVILNKTIDMKEASTGTEPHLADILNDRSIFPDGPPVCPFGQDYVVGQYGHVLPHNHQPQ